MLIARVLTLALIALLGAVPASAQISDGIVKIGVLNDQSSLYADLAGQGSVVAARMAVEDYGAAAKGLKVEIVFADHQNKADVGSQIARQWYDAEKVDLILDVPNSAPCLIALVVSPPALARPITLALEAWAWSRNEEKSWLLSG